MSTNTIAIDGTNKVLVFTLTGEGKSKKTVRIYPANIVALPTEKSSSTTAKYTANEFDVSNKLHVILTDNTENYRGSALITCDLIEKSWSIGATTYTDCDTLASDLLTLIASYK